MLIIKQIIIIFLTFIYHQINCDNGIIIRPTKNELENNKTIYMYTCLNKGICNQFTQHNNLQHIDCEVLCELSWKFAKHETDPLVVIHDDVTLTETLAEIPSTSTTKPRKLKFKRTSSNRQPYLRDYPSLNIKHIERDCAYVKKSQEQEIIEKPKRRNRKKKKLFIISTTISPLSTNSQTTSSSTQQQLSIQKITSKTTLVTTTQQTTPETETATITQETTTGSKTVATIKQTTPEMTQKTTEQTTAETTEQTTSAKSTEGHEENQTTGPGETTYLNTVNSLTETTTEEEEEGEGDDS